jgi:MurNAc alpha-1-phosphate uridylyltransferase
MRAMILAAGIGSRLRPLTDETPKALLDVGGKSMLEHAARRLQSAGAEALIVNAHHHAQKVADACARLAKQLKLPIEVSREDELLLDTGGGLKKASWFFEGGRPFLVHNADVLSDIDLRGLMTAQHSSKALATLAVMERPSSRKLSFTKDGRLIGRAGPADSEDSRPRAFCGVYAVSPTLFPLLEEAGVFSITDAFVRLAQAGVEIGSFNCDGRYWADIGTPEKLAAARAVYK